MEINCDIKIKRIKINPILDAQESDDFPPKNTQIRMNSLAVQLSVISSNYSTNFNSEINKRIISLAQDIIKFSESMHFVYGRELDGFNEEIDKHKATIDNLIKLIEASS